MLAEVLPGDKVLGEDGLRPVFMGSLFAQTRVDQEVRQVRHKI
jgi:hypothetical protein